MPLKSSVVDTLTAVQVTDTQLAYAAGIVDGEGCIRLNRRPNGFPAVRVHVTNTDPRLTALLKDWFGGYICVDAKQYMPNSKVRYVWEVSSIQAGTMLRAVLPYLVLKREQAEIVLAIQATKTPRGRSRLPAEVVIEREVLAGRLRALNKKGVA